MSARRRGCLPRCGFSSRRRRSTTQVQPVVVVPIFSESELVPCFAGEVDRAMGEQNPTSWKYTWKITNFTSLTQKKYYSEVFRPGDDAWRILIFPKGNNVEYLSVYLEAADPVRQLGWSRSAHFRLILVDQNNYGYSRVKETEHDFNARENDWGFTSFIPLNEVHDSHNGYLVNNTLTIEAEIIAPQPLAENTQLAEPPANMPPQVTATDTFDTYFTNLEEIINAAQSSPARGRSNMSNQKGTPSDSEAPTLEEVEKAKLSLKECLSDIFKLNVKDRLAEAVSTLSIAKSGLSGDQQKSVEAFWANFDEFTSDFLIFEQDNAEFELQKMLKDQMFATMKKNHETHTSYKQLLGDLTQEEEELNKKLEEVKSRREKLISDWEILMVESEEAKSGYKDQDKRVAEAEEKKRIAEERMSRSATAWSNLKTLFG